MEVHFKPNLPYRYTWNSNRSIIYILFKCPWNVLQDKSYVRPWWNLNRFKKIEIISTIYSDHNVMQL
jgi:hypothetical protein